MFIQLVGGGDIPCIQGHMHVHGPVGYPSHSPCRLNTWGFFVSGAMIMMSPSLSRLLAMPTLVGSDRRSRDALRRTLRPPHLQLASDTSAWPL
jgi:hypothetical protein